MSARNSSCRSAMAQLIPVATARRSAPMAGIGTVYKNSAVVARKSMTCGISLRAPLR